jgi:hypothetical protein
LSLITQNKKYNKKLGRDNYPALRLVYLFLFPFHVPLGRPPNPAPGSS